MYVKQTAIMKSTMYVLLELLPFIYSKQICLILAQTMLPLNPNVDYIAIGILMLNAAFDPLLYAAVRKPVRKGYLEIIKWIIYALSCFVPWLRPKNNFGKSIFTCSDLNLKMCMLYNNSKTTHAHMHACTHTHAHSCLTICSFLYR